jgi:nucleoside-diphosphate-sugar epimerase
VKFFLPIELAERELGYTTRSLEVTLRDQIQWLKENGKI